MLYWVIVKLQRFAIPPLPSPSTVADDYGENVDKVLQMTTLVSFFFLPTFSFSFIPLFTLRPFSARMPIEWREKKASDCYRLELINGVLIRKAAFTPS